MAEQSQTTVTRAMLEAAHNAYVTFYADREPWKGSSIAGIPYPVLKVIIEAALQAKEDNQHAR